MRKFDFEYDERKERLARVMAFLFLFASFIILALFVLSVSGCSHQSQVLSAEAHQAAAVVKLKGAQKAVIHAEKAVSAADKAKDGQIANLTQQVRFLLSLPASAKTVPVADQLLDATLSLTGAPTHENVLEQEVQDLLSTQAKNEAVMATIKKQDADLQGQLDASNADLAKAHSDLDAANQEIDKRDAKLAQVALASANVADEFDHWISLLWILGITAALATIIILFIKFGTQAAVATTEVASKVP